MANYEILDINDVDGVTVIRLRARELDETKIQQLTREFDSLAEEPQRHRIVIDLSPITFLTSTAIGALISLQKKLKANDRVLKLCNLQKDIHTLFSITQVDRLFDIRANEEDALSSFS